MTATAYTNLRRRNWVMAGLTTSGMDRRNKKHPELAGLIGRDYAREYMKKQRNSDRKAWEHSEVRKFNHETGK